MLCCIRLSKCRPRAYLCMSLHSQPSTIRHSIMRQVSEEAFHENHRKHPRWSDILDNPTCFMGTACVGLSRVDCTWILGIEFSIFCIFQDWVWIFVYWCLYSYFYIFHMKLQPFWLTFLCYETNNVFLLFLQAVIPHIQSSETSYDAWCRSPSWPNTVCLCRRQGKERILRALTPNYLWSCQTLRAAGADRIQRGVENGAQCWRSVENLICVPPVSYSEFG